VVNTSLPWTAWK